MRKASLVVILLMLPAQASALAPGELYLGADSLWGEGNFRGIVNLMNSELQKQQSRAAACYWMCKAYLALSDYDSSAFFGEKAVELAPDSSYYHLWYGRALGMRLSQTSSLLALFKAKKVKREFEKALELDPANNDAKFDLMQYHLQAPGILGGSKDEAFKLAEDIQESKPARGHFAKALCHQVRGDHDKADWEFRAASAYDSTNTEYAFNYFYFLLGHEDFAKAEAILEEIEKMDPDDPNILYQRGRLCLFSGKDLAQGLDCFREYLQTERLPGNPSYAAAHWRMGMIYEKMELPDAARTEYERCLELEPDYKEAKKALKRLM